MILKRQKIGLSIKKYTAEIKQLKGFPHVGRPLFFKT